MNPVMRRLMREYKELSQHPVREFRAMPLEDNMFEWHFTIQGPPDSPYADGLYHGRVLIPTNYPFAPPDVVLITPNGRFELEKKICLSISSYHPENWRSNWGVSTVLHALRQFMLTPGNSGIGAIEYPVETRRAMAKDSRDFKCAHCGRSCKDDWDIMLASPLATEMDMNATVPPTPMMTPQNSMGTPQSSFNPTNSNNNNNNASSSSSPPQQNNNTNTNTNNLFQNSSNTSSFPSTPSHKPSAVAASPTTNVDADDDLAALTKAKLEKQMDAEANARTGAAPAPTISPLSVGRPVITGSQNPTPQHLMNQEQQQQQKLPDDSATTKTPKEEDEKNKETPKDHDDNNNQKPSAEPTADSLFQKQPENNTNKIQQGEQQQEQQQQHNVHLPPGFNLPPPRAGGVPGNHRAAALRRNHIQQRNNVPFIRRDANGRLEINFSLAVLDRLVTFAAVFLAFLTAYKMAILFADPETVAGRVFDSVVSMGLDLVE